MSKFIWLIVSKKKYNYTFITDNKINYVRFRITSNVTKQGVTRTNEIYGGLNPNVTRVISLHGSLDPWHALGLTKDLNPSAPVIIIEGNYIENLKTIYISKYFVILLLKRCAIKLMY